MSMSVLSRALLAGLVCASLGAVQARAQAGPSGEPSTASQFRHASKCVLTLGFGGDCDKAAPTPKGAKATAPKGEANAVPTPAANDTSTRRRFLHASKCLVTVGLTSGCDKDAPAPKTEKSAAATEDTSTRHQFVRAGACVVTFGFSGDCDKK